MTHARISPTEAARCMQDEGYVYLDVRTPEEFGLGHPAGAYNVPFMLGTSTGTVSNPAFLRVVQASFAQDQKLLVGCQSGQRSLHASEALLAAGFGAVLEQRAGFGGVRDAFGRVTDPGWQAAGLPSTRQHADGHDYAALRARAGA